MKEDFITVAVFKGEIEQGNVKANPLALVT